MMDIPFYIVDAFSKVPFKGNQAGICLLQDIIDDITLQNIAFELNLSETAFLFLPDKKTDFSSSSTFKLRWFTPTNEIKLCGHATLASAHVLFNEMHNSNEIITFETLSGLLHVSTESDLIVMDFPINLTSPIDPHPTLQSYLGLKDSEIVDWAYDPNLMNLLIEVTNDEVVQRLEPDFGKLKSYKSDLKIAGVIITSIMKNKFDFVSRFFAPWIGINEDPVTGATHTNLGPYWSNKLHKNEFVASQISKRTGILKLAIKNDRIFIKGDSCIVLRGKFFI